MTTIEEPTPPANAARLEARSRRRSPSVVPAHMPIIDVSATVYGLGLLSKRGPTNAHSLPELRGPMNACGNAYWTATWRALDEGVRLSAWPLFGHYFDFDPSSPDFFELSTGSPPATSGVLGGSWCVQPSFIFESTDFSTLVDVVVLYQRWLSVP